MNHLKFKEEEELAVLEEVINHIKNSTMSFRKGAKYLSDVTNKKISHEGLRKIYNRTLREQADVRTEPESLGE